MLDATYALLLQDTADQAKFERILDEPFPFELTDDERRIAEMKRIADTNRAAVAALGSRCP